MKMFVFVSYAHDDADDFAAFDPYLRKIEQEIESEENVSLKFWSDQRSDTDPEDRIVAGGDWHKTIQKRIDKSRIFILLASKKYFRGEYVRTVELPEILVRHHRHGARIIPVVLQPCIWQLVLWRIHGVPNVQGRVKAVSDWPEDRRQDAFECARTQIKAAIKNQIKKRSTLSRIIGGLPSRSRMIWLAAASVAATVGIALSYLGLPPSSPSGPDDKVIYTAAPDAAYHLQFCEWIKAGLKSAGFNDYKCESTKGSLDNITKILASPSRIAISQYDVFAFQKDQDRNRLTGIVKDNPCETLWMITTNRNHTYENIRDLSKTGNITFILPPEDSGPAQTFKILKAKDPTDSLRLAKPAPMEKWNFDDFADKVIAGGENTVGFFVQFDEPENHNMKRLMEDDKLWVVPVWSSDIKRITLTTIADNNLAYRPTGFRTKVHLAANADIKEAKTVCTPISLVTGKSNEALIHQFKTMNWPDYREFGARP